MKRISLAIALCLLSFNQMYPQTTASRGADGQKIEKVNGIVAGRLAHALDEYVRRAEVFGFSGAVLVEKDGQIILHKGYGLADRQRKVPVTTNTTFYLASLSKEFTAAAILKLEMQGKLKVTDPISISLEGVPTDKATITIHHLLTHTSGLARDLPRDSPEPSTSDGFAKAVLNIPLRFTPGEKHEYSNAGYSLLAAIVEKVSGQSFASYTSRYLFEAAGMTSSGFITESIKRPSALLAHSYYGDLDEGDALLSHQKPFRWSDIGGTGLVSTTGDLYRWEKALRGNLILSESAKKKFFTPFLERYAYGWVVQTTGRGTALIWHDGLSLPAGWNAQFRRYIDDRVTIIVLSNAHRDEPLGWLVTNQLAGLTFGGTINMPPADASIGASELKRYIGTYALPSGARFKVFLDGEHLSIKAEGQEAVNLLVYKDRNKSGLHKDENARAQTFFESLSKNDFESIKRLLTANKPLASWKDELTKRWQWFEEKFGRFERAEIINSFGSDNPDEWTRIFVRLYFSKGKTVIRTLWEKGLFRGMSDSGAFGGKAQEVPVFPTTMSLARETKDRFTLFDIDTSKSLSVSFGNGESETINKLILHVKNGDVTATRAQ